MRTPDGAVRLDPTGRAAGRGAYVCRDAACIDVATSKGAFARALEVQVPDGLAFELGRLTTGPEGGSRGQE